MEERKQNIYIAYGNDLICGRTHILQLISKAYLLALESDATVHVICAGSGIPDKDFFLYGAHNIKRFHVTGSNVKLVDLLQYACRDCLPDLIIFPATERGCEAAALLAVRLDAGLTAECIDIQYTKERGYIFTRAAMSSSVLAQIVGQNSRAVLCTVKENAFTEETYLIEKGTTENCELGGCPYEDFIQVLDSYELPVRKLSGIQSAKRIFAIGRGVHSKELYNRIVLLAEKYDAVVGGTRAVVEDGRLEKERQIGQSGITVKPELYVGFGISGASQHMVGIRDAGTIIAINRDPNAPIFEYADYALIEDVEQIVVFLEKRGGKEHASAVSTSCGRILPLLSEAEGVH